MPKQLTMGTVAILVLTHLSVLVIGWIIGASKASCPPLESDYGNPAETSYEPLKPIIERFEEQDEVADDETPIALNLETEMAQYIILKNGWELKPVGDKETKIVATNTNDTKYIITKQLTSEINKWIVDNYEPNGELKVKEDEATA